MLIFPDLLLTSCSQTSNIMRGERFVSPGTAVETLRTLVSEVITSEWKNCFENWFERVQKCIDFKGENSFMFFFHIVCRNMYHNWKSWGPMVLFVISHDYLLLKKYVTLFRNKETIKVNQKRYPCQISIELFEIRQFVLLLLYCKWLSQHCIESPRLSFILFTYWDEIFF